MSVTRLGCFTQDALDGLLQTAPPTNQTVTMPNGTSYRINGQVKLFHRLTSAGASGGTADLFGTQVKTEYTGTASGHNALESTCDWKAAGATGGGVRGLLGVARLASTFTMTGGSVIGTYGQAANNGTMNGSGIMMAALYGLLEDGGTFTAVSHIAALWLDSHLTKTITAGRLSMAYITNNAASIFNEVFYIYGGNGIQSFAAFDTCGTMIVKTPGTYSTADGYIAITVDGDAMRIPYFAGTD